MKLNIDSIDFCKHEHGTYIGLQPDPIRGTSFALYLCDNCRSTYSMPITRELASIEMLDFDYLQARVQRVAV